MKYLFLLIFILFNGVIYGQKLSGQWSGDFGTSSGLSGQKTEYILELEVNGTEIKGFSYTYFTLATKRCYVICKLAGSFDKNSKSMLIAEVDKVKSNTPPDFKDCLQKHELTYFKSGGKEILSGKWTPVDPKSGCGSGITILERKPIVKTNNSNIKNDNSGKVLSQQPTEKNPSANLNQTDIKFAQNENADPSKKSEIPIRLNNNEGRKATIEQKSTIDVNSKNSILKSLQNKTAFNERSFQILKTIELENKNFKVQLYDNGQVDGDTISLYFNGKLLVSQKRLTTAPITLDIKMDIEKDFSELVMYADNLGTIPPNTALMIITDGDKRYELNISSSEMTNGTVRFKLKKP